MEKELIDLMKELLKKKGHELKTIEIVEYTYNDGSGHKTLFLNRQYVGREIGGYTDSCFAGRYYQKRYSLYKINQKQLNKEIENGYYIHEIASYGKVLVKVVERIEL